MKMSLIDAEQAPPRPGGPYSKRTTQVHNMVASLVAGKVAKIELEGNETARGAKASVTRAAKKLGRSVAVWDSEGAVYAQLADETGRRRRGA